MIKVFIDKNTKEITRKYHIEYMFDSISPNEFEDEIITDQVLELFKAYVYNEYTGLFEELQETQIAI